MPVRTVIVEGADTTNYQSVVDVGETLQPLEIFQGGLATTLNETWLGVRPLPMLTSSCQRSEPDWFRPKKGKCKQPVIKT